MKNVEDNNNKLNQEVLILRKEKELMQEKLRELSEVEREYSLLVDSKKYRCINRLFHLRDDISNLGTNGENLTWVVKGDERALTMLESFFRIEKAFSGKVLIIVCQLSEEKRLEFEKVLKNKISYEFYFSSNNENLFEILNGVSEQIDTEWGMYVDSGYIFTKPCLQEMDKALSLSGCYFMNLPVISVRSGWVYENQICNRGSEIRYTKEIFPFANLLNTSAFVFKRDPFYGLGKIETNCMESVSTNITAKIACKNYAIANCKDVFLQGDLKEVKVEGIRKTGRLRVALVVDTENWAYHNIAKQIQEKLSNEMDVEIFFYDYTPNAVQIILACRNYDLIHFLWREVVSVLQRNRAEIYLRQIGLSYEEFKKYYLDNVCITTSVYDHMCIDTEKNLEITKEILDFCDEYTVSSKVLYNIYYEKFEKKPYTVLTDGVDLEVFYPLNLDRLKNRESKELVIGWVGNSCFWGNQELDLKGVHTIINPAVELLKERGCVIKNRFADRQERIIPHEEMGTYYSTIDILICASITEGTPNPVLEAMACGVPIISTDVGIVREVLGDFQKEFILSERTPECLAERIQYFYEHPELLWVCSKENLERIQTWTWEIKTQEFKEFFERVKESNKKMVEIKKR